MADNPPRTDAPPPPQRPPEESLERRPHFQQMLNALRAQKEARQTARQPVDDGAAGAAHSGDRNAGPPEEAEPMARVADQRVTPLFTKSPVRTNRDVLDHGPGTPMTLDNVHAIADRMDIDLDDVDVVIITDSEEIRYLDHMEAGAYTPSELNGTEIRLGPASFADDETLAATIAHEHMHVQQIRAGDHLRLPLGELEAKAYESEEPALERYRNRQP